MADEQTGTTSHNGEQLKRISTDLKLEAVGYAEKNRNNMAASRKYKVAPRIICDWRARTGRFLELHKKSTAEGKRFCLDGGGRKIMNAELEDTLLEWTSEKPTNGFRASRELIKAKASKFYNEGQSVDKETKALAFSDGGVQKFLNRNGLSIR